METRSLVALEQLAQRAEAIAGEMLQLDSPNTDVDIPDIPLPLSLKGTEEWLRTVDECRRKPRLARSKRLLEVRGIDAASIPAAVLEHSESIAELLEKIDAFPAELGRAAIPALGRALTKDLDDATMVLEQFSAAADAIGELEGDAADQPWIYNVALATVADTPQAATELVDRARDVLHHCSAAARYGVTADAFETFEDALMALSQFSRAVTDYNHQLAAEGLSGERADIDGHDVVSATSRLHQDQRRIDDEKRKLIEQMQELTAQLGVIGGNYHSDATTVAELRSELPQLQSALDGRRRDLRASLGKDVFQIVESLAKSQIPATNRVSDAKLGQALRKAAECGYRVWLEVPREDQ